MPITSTIPAHISQVQIGDTVIAVEVADTEEKRELGLSYRDVLLPGNGMLFMFETPDRYGFWMKDTHLALDIIFIDSRKRIVSIDKNAQPESYNENPPRVFYPPIEILYALEVPGGYTDEHNIAEGMTVQFLQK